MRKAFTMIELIFVIVILGILAAIAIPRLAATRDDAEVVKASTNFDTLQQDLMGYYTATGTVDSDISKMTNIVVYDIGEYTANFYVGKSPCLEIEIDANNTTSLATITPVSDPSKLCEKFLRIEEIQKAVTYGVMSIKAVF